MALSDTNGTYTIGDNGVKVYDVKTPRYENGVLVEENAIFDSNVNMGGGVNERFSDVTGSINSLAPEPEPYVNPYDGGPQQQELSPHLSSIHNQPTWEGQLYTTTDLSAPLGGTYSLMSNTGLNADAPITYDFLNHMPDLWDRTAGQSAVGDYVGAIGPRRLAPSDPRYTEDYARILHDVADTNASRAFTRKYMDDMKKRLGDYRYGTAYALDSTSPNGGVDPIPLLGEWVNRDPNDTRVPYESGDGTLSNQNRQSQVKWDEGMGPDYEYSEQNYAGYDGNRFKTLDENGSVIQYNNYADLERDGEYFNTGYNRKKFTNIPYITDRVNPAVHPEYIGHNGEAVKWENGYAGINPYDDNYFNSPPPEYDFNNNPNQQYYDNPNQQGDYYNQQSDWIPNYNYQTGQYDEGYGPTPDIPTSTGPSYGSDYASAMTNQMNSPSSGGAGGGFGLGYDSAMTSSLGSDVSSAKSFSTEYEENIKGLLDTLRRGG